MSDSGLDKARMRTPDEARAEIAQKDRASWYAGKYGGVLPVIIAAADGREVATCLSENDRDTILTMARSHDAMRAALEAAQQLLEMVHANSFGADYQLSELDKPLHEMDGWKALVAAKYNGTFAAYEQEFADALALARGVKP